MPYKASNSWVMVLRDGRWVRYRKADSESHAERWAAALNANVTANERRRRRRRRMRNE